MDLVSPASTLTVTIANSLILPLHRIPLIFHLSPLGIPQFSRSTSYQSFLASLKLWAAQEGHDPMDIGTHSLRRGLASDWALLGVPDCLRMVHGRWRSAIVSDGYIDESVHIQQCLNVFHSHQSVSAVSLPPLSESLGPQHQDHMMDTWISIPPPPSPSPSHPVVVSQTPSTPTRRPTRNIRRPPCFSE